MQGGRAEYIGRYSHKVGNYVVVDCEGAVPRIGARVFDEKGKQRGIVADVIGSVHRPLVVIKGEVVQKYYVRVKDVLTGGG